jgi:CTP:molybdopterin cytidylyltransferase MocA
VIAVLGAKAEAIQPIVDRAGAQAVVNEHYVEGRATSVRAGAQALDEALDRVLILNVDQPRPAAVHRKLLDEMESAQAPIAVAIHNGQRGHPVAFAAALFAELREVRDATQGLREVVRRHEAEVLEVPFGTPVVVLDINRPDDYQAAKAHFEKVEP